MNGHTVGFDIIPRLAIVPATIFVAGMAVVENTGVGSLDYTIVAVALIAAVPGTLAAWSAARAAKTAANKADEAKMEIADTKAEIVEARQNLVEIKLSVDGFMEKYSIARDEAARAGGIADERQAGLERAADAAVASAVVTADVAATNQAAAESRQPEPSIKEVVVQALTDSNMEQVATQTARVADETARLADVAEGKPTPPTK